MNIMTPLRKMQVMLIIISFRKHMKYSQLLYNWYTEQEMKLLYMMLGVSMYTRSHDMYDSCRLLCRQIFSFVECSLHTPFRSIDLQT